MEEERRKYQRYLFGDDESFTCSFEWNGTEVLDLRIVRLSAKGMFAAYDVAAEHTLKKDERIDNIRFALKSYEILVPRGRIAHNYDFGTVSGYGIEFLELADEQMESLDNLLNVTVREARASRT